MLKEEIKWVVMTKDSGHWLAIDKKGYSTDTKLVSVDDIEIKPKKYTSSTQAKLGALWFVKNKLSEIDVNDLKVSKIKFVTEEIETEEVLPVKFEINMYPLGIQSVDKVTKNKLREVLTNIFGRPPKSFDYDVVTYDEKSNSNVLKTYLTNIKWN